MLSSLLVFLFSNALFAQSIQFELRYAHSQTLSDQLSQTAIYQRELSEQVLVDLSARATQSLVRLENIDGKVEFRYSPFSFFTITPRYSHSVFISDGASESLLSLRGGLRTEIGPHFGLFFAAGCYLRWVLLNYMFPINLSSNYTDFDLMTEFGFWVKPAENVKVQLQVDTFEELDTYNLNNPRVKLSVELPRVFSPANLKLFYANKLLLGFGHLDEVQAGLGLELPL